MIEILSPHEAQIQGEILQALDRESPCFPKRFAGCLSSLKHGWAWLSSRLGTLSEAKRNDFVQPLNDVQRRYQRLLQSFRDRLSERATALYGVPLRTTEPEITRDRRESQTSRSVEFSITIGNCCRLSSRCGCWGRSYCIIFRRKIADETFKNFSRLSTQWDEILRSAVSELQGEAEARLENVIATVEKLTSETDEKRPRSEQIWQSWRRWGPLLKPNNEERPFSMYLPSVGLGGVRIGAALSNRFWPR